MKIYVRVLAVAVLLSGWLAADVQAQAGASDIYNRQINVVYAEAHGTGMIMDIFTPKADANGLGIIDVLSGAWYSAPGQLRDHMRAKIFDIYCSHGYTVFMIRPGSRTKYSVDEMVSNLKTGIRYVKYHAGEYKIDPDRLGITGASAGGHLTLLTLARTEAGNPQAKDELKRLSTEIKAAAVFFPPTDFLDVNGGEWDLARLSDLLFPGGICNVVESEMRERAASISTARQVRNAFPPVLFIHGDADPVVPLQQSEKMVEVLKKAGGKAELIVKPGGGHPWPTISEEVEICADWFDRKL